MAYGYEGIQLTFGQALAVCKYVGFEYGHGLLRAVATSHGESGRFLGAWHENMADDGVTVLSTDWGWFQINDQHKGQISVADMKRAVPAARFAFQLSKEGKDFNPWYAYKNRSAGYQDGLKWARWFYDNGRGWRKMDVAEMERNGELG